MSFHLMLFLLAIPGAVVIALVLGLVRGMRP